jgi:hypothetical protein
MSTQLETRPGTAPKVELTFRPNPLFTIVAIAAIIVGSFAALGGIAGAIYTYQTAAVENITTPDDARIPGTDVRGPISMWVQSDIITEHQLARTEGLRFAEMDRLIPQLDENGQVVLDEAGDPVMVDNAARASWINATALTTVLALGIISYAFSAFALVVGLMLIGLGLVVYKLRNTTPAIA